MSRSHFRHLTVASLVVATLWGSLAQACPQVRPEGDLIVGARKDARPVTYFEDGTAKGFAVNLWNDVVGSLSVPDGQGGTRPPDYTIVECETIDAQELALQEGRIDVIISPLTITSERMDKYDFSQRILSSGLSVAVPTQSAINFKTATKIITETLFAQKVALAVLGFLAFNFVAALFIRWLLFSPEDRHAGGKIGAAIRAGLEAIMRTLGLRGVSDGYKGATSKVFEIFLAIVGTILSATILGILTSAFVGAVGEQNGIPKSQLPPKRVATLNCSTAQALLQVEYRNYVHKYSNQDTIHDGLTKRAEDLNCTPTPDDGPLPTFDTIAGFPGEVTLTRSWAEAMKLLAEDKVDVVLGDWVAMTYLSRHDFAHKVDVLPKFYRNEPYGWGISRVHVSEDIRRDIDQALIKEIRDVKWRTKLEIALGSGSVAPN